MFLWKTKILEQSQKRRLHSNSIKWTQFSMRPHRTLSCRSYCLFPRKKIPLKHWQILLTDLKNSVVSEMFLPQSPVVPNPISQVLVMQRMYAYIMHLCYFALCRTAASISLHAILSCFTSRFWFCLFSVLSFSPAVISNMQPFPLRVFFFICITDP